MKTIILLMLSFGLLNADLAMPNSKSVSHTVVLTNAEDFKEMAVLYCTSSMGGRIGCGKLKNNEALINYKFASTPYLFAIKKDTYEKYDKLGFFGKKAYQKALYELIKDLKTPIGVSSTSYVSLSDVSSETKDTTSRFKIIKIENGYLHLELLKD